MQRQVAWINDFEDTYVCTTVELASWRIKKNKADHYTHKRKGKPFHEEKKWYKIINIKIAESTKTIYGKETIVHAKFYSLDILW